MSFLTPTQATDFLPKAYDSFAKDFSSTRHYQWKEFERLSKGVHEVENLNTKYILDLGCGNGRLNKFLRDENSTNINFRGKYIGFDISKELLEEAKKNTADDTIQNTVEFIEAGFLDFPKFLPEDAKNNVAQVWAVASFHHLSKISERKKTLENIYSVLEEGGEFVCTVWNLWEQEKYEPQKKEALWRSLYNPFWNKRDFIIPFGQKKIKRYYYSFEISELHALLEESGFTIVESFYSVKKQNICIRAKKIRKTAKFICADIPFHRTTLDEVIENIDNFRHSKESGIQTVVTPNPEMIMECRGNTQFKGILQNSNISLADGNGILWASGLDSLRHKPIIWKYSFGIAMLFWFLCNKKSYPSKIKYTLCGSDLFKQYLEYHASADDAHIFLLGGAENSASFIQKKYSHIVSGFYDKKVTQDTSSQENKDLLHQIRVSGATVVFVALGAPKQEIWIENNKKFLEENTKVKVCIGVGGSFDFISGKQKRAPQFFRKYGLEWLYRMWKEPSRLKRIWTATGKFIHYMLSK